MKVSHHAGECAFFKSVYLTHRGSAVPEIRKSPELRCRIRLRTLTRESALLSRHFLPDGRYTGSERVGTRDACALTPSGEAPRVLRVHSCGRLCLRGVPAVRVRVRSLADSVTRPLRCHTSIASSRNRRRYPTLCLERFSYFIRSPLGDDIH